MKTTVSAAGVAVLFVAGFCTAQTADSVPINAARPGFSEPASLVPTHILQFEGGYTYARSAGTTQHTLGNWLVRYALSHHIEIGLGVNSYLFTRSPRGDRDGFADASVNLRIAVSQYDDVKLRIGILLASTVPTGAESYRNDDLQPSARLAMEWDLSDNLSVWSNIGYALIRDESGDWSEFALSIAAGRGLTERTGVYTEFFRLMPEHGYGASSDNMQSGVTFLPNNDLQLDLHGGFELTADKLNYFLGCGAAFRILIR